MNYAPNVTMIDDLPDLDELVGGYDSRMQGIPEHMSGRGFSGYRGQPPVQDMPDVSRSIRGHHVPPMESGMMGPPKATPHNMAGGGYNKYGAAYGPQTGPGPHRMPQHPQRMVQGRPINLGPGLQAPEPPHPSIMNQRGIPVMAEDINPYPFAGSQDVYSIDVNEGYEGPKNMGNCLDINNHIENCPICQRIYKNDKTVLIIAIVILAILCILLLKKVLNL